MEIKQLRIGNLILDPDGYQVEVTELSLESIGTEDSLFHAEDANGIELTPEWLERFGFEYERQTNGGYERWEIKTTKGRRIKLLDKKFTWGAGEYSDYILHVHQLQNLYLSLTGEELAIDKTSLKN